METFVFQIKMTVEVEAFNYSDALDAVQDVFSIGEEAGLVVTKCEYKDIKK